MRNYILVSLLLVSCANLTPIEQQGIDCLSTAGQTAANPLISQVEGVLSGGAINWQSTLNTLLTSAGAGLVCAVEDVVKDLSTSAARTSAQEVALVRGQAWLSSEGHYKLVR